MARSIILILKFDGTRYPLKRDVSGRYFILVKVNGVNKSHYFPKEAGLSDDDQKDLEKVIEAWDNEIIPMAMELAQSSE